MILSFIPPGAIVTLVVLLDRGKYQISTIQYSTPLQPVSNNLPCIFSPSHNVLVHPNLMKNNAHWDIIESHSAAENASLIALATKRLPPKVLLVSFSLLRVIHVPLLHKCNA